MMRIKIYSLSNLQICNTVLLTRVAMLYITSLWIFYFVTRSSYLFDHLHLFLLTPHLWQPLVCSLYLWAWFCLLDSPFKSDHGVFVFLQLISLSTVPLTSIHVAANDKVLPIFLTQFYFLWLNNIPVCVRVCVCVYIFHRLYPLIHQWT